MKLTPKKINSTIHGRMTRKEYWQMRKDRKAAYKKQVQSMNEQLVSETAQIDL